MQRRRFLHAATLAIVSAPFTVDARWSTRNAGLEELTMRQLRQLIKARKESAESLARKYLSRIRDLDQNGPALNSVIELNPEALSIARALDKEEKTRGPRGPLHGIPILIKDNIATHDRMTTTAGSLALVGSIPPFDAFLVKRLREAGAVILGKTNLSEWANFRGDRSTSGWSGRGGLTKNPYALDRNPSGSSSGSAVAVAANLCAAAVGTETDGSIISPSAVCGIVGLKPTVGLVSRSGIIPISHTQDTAGPMTRTVEDAAALLTVLAGYDAKDRAGHVAQKNGAIDYTRFLDADGLQKARLGVARRFFRGTARTNRLLESAIEAMRAAGATIVDPIDDSAFGKISGEGEVLQYEFKEGLNAYLASLGPGTKVRTLQDVIEFNEKNKEKELQFFGQETLIRSQAKGPLTDKAYLQALETCRQFSQKEGIDAMMERDNLDAIIAPAGGPAGKTDLIYGNRGVGGSSSPAAVAGYPNITVPAGHIFGLPVGISFFGRKLSEPTLLKLAYAFEQQTKLRQRPSFASSLP